MALVAFDFDGTLSDEELVVLLGRAAGEEDAIDEITERAMAGELDYAVSLRERVGRLEGLEPADAAAAFEEVELRPGTVELLAELRRKGTTTAVLTGGFEEGVRAALDRAGAGVDRIVANRLGRDSDGRLDGTVDGPLVQGTKDVALRELADELDVTMAETVAVGDGANDVPMLEAAGRAIGFRPKPSVAEHCDVIVESMAELRSVLVEGRDPSPG